MKRVLLSLLILLLSISLPISAFADVKTTEEEEEDTIDAIGTAAPYVLAACGVMILVWAVSPKNKFQGNLYTQKGELSLSDNLSFKLGYSEFNSNKSFDHTDSFDFDKRLILYPTVTVSYSW